MVAAAAGEDGQAGVLPWVQATILGCAQGHREGEAMKSTFTPGPWRSQAYHVWALGNRIPNDLSVNDHCIVPRTDGRTKEEAEANARLIAQAPAMLEALRHAINWADGWERVTGEKTTWGDEARAILRAIDG